MVFEATFNNISVISWRSVFDNPETLATLGTQDTGQINLRENLKGQSRTDIQRHWQHWAQMTQGQNNTKHRKHHVAL
jgi:hypothetical protein